VNPLRFLIVAGGVPLHIYFFSSREVPAEHHGMKKSPQGRIDKTRESRYIYMKRQRIFAARKEIEIEVSKPLEKGTGHEKDN